MKLGITDTWIKERQPLGIILKTGKDPRFIPNLTLQLGQSGGGSGNGGEGRKERREKRKSNVTSHCFKTEMGFSYTQGIKGFNSH